MSNVSLGKKRLAWVRTLLTSLFVGILCIPVSLASAITIEPAQILPPATGKSCSPVVFSDITPYIYEGNLDSFDVVVSDNRYVAISTSVHGNPVAYNYITRWQNPDGSLKMHVDLPSIRMDRDVAVDITFLSTITDANGLAITCMMQISSSIAAIPGLGEAERTPNIYIPVIQTPKPEIPATSTTVSNGSKDRTPNMGLVAVTNSLGKLCANGGAGKLWVVLLVLYAVFVITLLMQKIEPGDLGREWNIVLILGIFLALLVFWYVSSVCRAGPWAPAIATLVAVAGLIYTMLQDDGPQKMLLLKDGKK